jgi:hypothetical protein
VIAGLRFKTSLNDSIIEVKGEDPSVDDSVEGQLTITWAINDPVGKIKMIFNESSISITAEGKLMENWFLELSYARDKALPFVSISTNRIDCNYKGFDYSLEAKSGAFIRANDIDLRIIPDEKGIILSLSTN